MAKNPARMYRKITQYAYTRREFMGGVPGNRILQYESGKAIGTAARTRPGQSILTIKVPAKGFQNGKDAMRKAYNKIASPCHIDVEGLEHVTF